jgi:hypothetical protein
MSGWWDAAQLERELEPEPGPEPEPEWEGEEAEGAEGAEGDAGHRGAGEDPEYTYLRPGEWAKERGWATIDTAPLGPRIRAKEVAAERRELRSHAWMTGKNGEHISLLTADGQYIDIDTFRCDMQQTNTCCEMLSLLEEWGVVKILA